MTLRLLEESPPSPAMLSEAATNLFTLAAFLAFNEKYPAWVDAPPVDDMPRALCEFAGQPVEQIPAALAATASRWMAESMGRHQLADRAYWRPIIAQLRELRAAGRLAPEGTAV